MTQTHRHPKVAALAELHPLGRLSRVQLELLSQILWVHQAPAGEVLLQLGDTDRFNLYLLMGSLRLDSADDRSICIASQSPEATQPIAQLIPRRYRVTALSEVEYLCVEGRLLDGLLRDEDLGITATELPPEALESDAGSSEYRLSEALLKDLENDRLVLPSLPDVAVRVGRAMRDETSDAHTLAKIIQTDPVITAKLIRAANSPLYAGVNPVESCSAAVVRLGADTTHQLVLSFALRELFDSHLPLLKRQMHQLWEHSVRVSALCYVLARIQDGFNPEHALLAGLLHDIGSVAILSYAAAYPEIARDEARLAAVIEEMRGPIGSHILRAWEFMPDLVRVAEDAEDWRRETPGPADYADLVIVAQIHAYIGTPRMHQLPSLDQVPAFARLGLGEFSPRLGILILDKAQEKIARAEALLR